MFEREGYELTKKQKAWVLERDGYQPGEAEIHHIVPIAYAVTFLGLTRGEINDPELLIALLSDVHRSIHKPPHEMGDWRETGEPYWNTENDVKYIEQAMERTRVFEEQGNIFPGKR